MKEIIIKMVCPICNNELKPIEGYRYPDFGCISCSVGFCSWYYKWFWLHETFKPYNTIYELIKNKPIKLDGDYQNNVQRNNS